VNSCHSLYFPTINLLKFLM